MIRMLMSVALLAGLSGISNPAAARSPKPQVEGTGELLTCLQLNRVRNTCVLDDQTVLFYTKDRKVYRNALSHRCPSLGFHEAFSYRAHGGSLCSSDLIEVLEPGPGLRGATCGLSEFERVEVVKAARKS